MASAANCRELLHIALELQRLPGVPVLWRRIALAVCVVGLTRRVLLDLRELRPQPDPVCDDLRRRLQRAATRAATRPSRKSLPYYHRGPRADGLAYCEDDGLWPEHRFKSRLR